MKDGKPRFEAEGAHGGGAKYVNCNGQKTDTTHRPKTARARACSEAHLPDPLRHQPKAPESFPDTRQGRLTWTTLLSSGLTASEKLTAGIATCPPSVGFLGHHRHEQAELYFILEGEGLMKVEQVEKGGVIFIPGNAEHGISNLSGEKDLVWLYCFPTDRFEDVVYKFSDDGEGG